MIQYKNKSNEQYKYFSFLSALYSTLLIASVLLPYKIISFFGFAEPGGIFIFPLTYLLGGAIAEVYGRKLALKMIYSSIICLLIFNTIIATIIRIPSISNAPHQDIFIQAFGHGIRLSLGCLIGLLCSDLTNIYKITKLKALFKGKYFLQRCLWSTAISETLFNISTYIITYLGVLPFLSICKLVISSWILKMTYTLTLILPSLFFMRLLKKIENVDVYDVKNTTSKLNPEVVFVKFLNAL